MTHVTFKLRQRDDQSRPIDIEEVRWRDWGDCEACTRGPGDWDARARPEPLLFFFVSYAIWKRQDTASAGSFAVTGRRGTCACKLWTALENRMKGQAKWVEQILPVDPFDLFGRAQPDGLFAVRLEDDAIDFDVAIVMDGKQLDDTRSLEHLRDLLEPRPPHPAALEVEVLDRLSGWPGSIRSGGVLPLRPDDGVRVTVTLERPAHVYLLWIDAGGVVTPLFPWRDGDWNDIPDGEDCRRICLDHPRDPGHVLELTPGPRGLETAVLLTRSQGLTPAARLPRRLVLAPGLGLGALESMNARELFEFAWPRPAPARGAVRTRGINPTPVPRRDVPAIDHLQAQLTRAFGPSCDRIHALTWARSTAPARPTPTGGLP